MKVVLDTNIIFSGIFFGGLPGKILDLWITDSVQLVGSEPILTEYIRIIQEFAAKNKFTAMDEWVILLSENIELISVDSNIEISRDKDDDKFINCAKSAGIKYIVSGDGDLLVLKKVHDIEILTAREFLLKISDSPPPA
jgi:uncharacterized protein